MLSIRLDSPIALTDQLEAGLRRLIALGALSPGQQLPSVRQLAADLGINLNTVARAYQRLEADGLVTPAQGRGTRVCGTRVRMDADQARAALQAALEKALADAKLADIPPDAVRDAFQRTFEQYWPDPEHRP